jgi:ATP-binding cassette, subfamily C, bacterial exporter for protease/lipase
MGSGTIVPLPLLCLAFARMSQISSQMSPVAGPTSSNRELMRSVKTLWPHLAMAGLFSGAINLLYLSSPLYLMQVYNRVLMSENLPTLVLLTAILVIALVTMAALDCVRAQVLIRCGVRLEGLLARRIFDALVVRSARHGYSRGAQQLREFDQFRTFVTGPGIYFAFDLPWIPIYLLLLFFIDPILGIVATLGAAMMLGLAMLNESLTHGTLKAAEDAGNRAYTFVENILRHADVVRAMAMRPAVERVWNDNRSFMLSRQADASDRNAVISSGIRFARLLLQSLMLGTGAWLAIDHIIMPATIFAASIIMGRALVPVEQAVSTWKQFTSARDGYARVEELLDDVPPEQSRTILPMAANALVADGVTYLAPSQRKPILKDMSFELSGGHTIGLVGPSGSGKSTLARLLVGAIQPDEGKLRFGGIDYEQWDPLELGRQIGYLPQDVGLFSGTIRENIARFGSATIEEVIEASKLASIHDMILDLPKQYDTPLGPGGVGLSGGQRQRLALARALLGRPSLVVLDEPNANLDTSGEGALRDALLQLKTRGVTIVVVTHRSTILDIVDQLMFVRAGRLEKLGPPDTVYAYIRQNVAGPPVQVES